MASWRTRLHAASFRGVPFESEAVVLATPQRLGDHEFPGMDGGYSEPLGRGAREWTVNAFVIGDDYLDKKEALRAALDESGPGEYVDPFFPTPVNAVVPAASISEGVTEGLGWARFALTVRESTDPRAMVLTDAATVEGASEATSALAALAAGAMESYTSALNNARAYALAAAQTATSYAERVEQISDAVFGPLAATIDALGDVADSLQEIENEITDILTDPAVMWARLAAVWDQIDSLAAVEYFTTGDAATETTPLTGQTPAEAAANDADLQTQRMGLRVALLRQGALLQTEAWTSADQALAARDRWAARMLAQEEGEGAALMALFTDARGAVSYAVEQTAAKLPRLVTVEIGQPTSTLELAQRYYGDYTRAGEIADLNQVIHPGFVTGTVTLLSR